MEINIKTKNRYVDLSLFLQIDIALQLKKKNQLTAFNEVSDIFNKFSLSSLYFSND